MIEVACACDRAFLPRTATMIVSLLDHVPGPRVHLLADTHLEAHDIDRLRDMVAAGGGELQPVWPAEQLVSDLKTAGPFPAPIWFRAALPILLRDTSRVIYLDSDTLVLDALDPLWATELGSKALGAVPNVFPDARLDRHAAALGVDPATYFNSGVLFMDLDAMRARNSFGRVRDFAVAHRERLIFPDQDALNGALGSDYLPLHPRWNLMNGMLRHAHATEVFSPDLIAAARAHPAIRHFEGTMNKPWMKDAPRADQELWERYATRVPELLR